MKTPASSAKTYGRWSSTGSRRASTPVTRSCSSSHGVYEHAELHLLLSMVTPLGWLERVPSYKDQQEKLRERDLATFGFLGYPLLQSADILIYRAGLVPVGEDQVAHVELTREIARRFKLHLRAGAGLRGEGRGCDQEDGEEEREALSQAPAPGTRSKATPVRWRPLAHCSMISRTSPWEIASGCSDISTAGAG